MIEQLENFAHTCGLKVYKTPSEEEATTVNAFLNTDDFFFEVSVSINGKQHTHTHHPIVSNLLTNSIDLLLGEITDVKFSIFSEKPKVSLFFKDNCALRCALNPQLLFACVEQCFIEGNILLVELGLLVKAH